MNSSSLFITILILFGFYTMANGSAFADRDAIPQAQNFDRGWDLNSLNDWGNAYMKNIKLSLHNVRNELKGIPIDQDNSKQGAAEVLVKVQEGIETQQIWLQDQALHMDDFREEQNIQKQRQQDFMDDMKDIISGSVRSGASSL